MPNISRRPLLTWLSKHDQAQTSTHYSLQEWELSVSLSISFFSLPFSSLVFVSIVPLDFWVCHQSPGVPSAPAIYTTFGSVNCSLVVEDEVCWIHEGGFLAASYDDALSACNRLIFHAGLEKWQKAADDYKMVMELEPGGSTASEGYRRALKFAKDF